MSKIFNIRKRKSEKQTHLIGAYMPDEFVSSLTLYCLSKGISKSCIIQELLQEWHSKVFQKESESVMDEIVFLIQHDWNIRKMVDKINKFNVVDTFSAYKKGVTETLLSKKIKETKINEIMDMIKI